MGFRPLHDWVLIRRDEAAEKTAGGIIIPETAKDKPAEGMVISVGPGRFRKEEGRKGKAKEEKKFVPTVLKPGQRVTFIDYMAKDVNVGGETITLIREDDILGTLEGKGEVAVKAHYHLETKADRPPMVRPRTVKAPEKEAVTAPAPDASKKAAAAGAGKVSKKKTPARAAKTSGGKTAVPAKKAKKTAAKKKTSTASPAKKGKTGKAASVKAGKTGSAAKRQAVSKKASPKTRAKTSRPSAAKKAAAKKPASKKVAPKKAGVKR